MRLLDKVLPVLGKTLFITSKNVFNAISDFFCKTGNGKPTMNSESMMEKTDLISLQIIR